MTRYLCVAGKTARPGARCPARLVSSRWPLALGVALVASGAIAQAQGPVAPLGAAAPVTANALNVLVLPLDDLSGAAPVVPPMAPDAPPTPLASEPVLVPTIARATSSLKLGWLVNADKRKEKNDEIFAPTPDFGNNRTPPPSPLNSPVIAQAPAQPVGNPNQLLNQDVPPLYTPPGRAQLTAISLRSGLTAQGYTDVLNAAPDSATIMRALGERRLTPRVLQTLKSSLAALLQNPTDANSVAVGTRAATRIGQAVGYRAIVPLYMDQVKMDGNGAKASFVLLLVDAARESGRAILFDATGADEKTVRDAGASTATALLNKSLQEWTPANPTDKVTLAQTHFNAAKAALAAKNLADAQDELNQAIALNPSNPQAYVMLGDALATNDPQTSALAYRRAVDANARDGETWAKIAASYANAATPDWPRTLEAGRKALAVGYDSVQLRVAMATAQFGRADLFRRADRLERAEDAEFDARNHLDRALQLAPDDPTAIRLLARSLVSQGRYDDAIQSLDRIAPRFPKDVEIQSQYAAALVKKAGREEDAFVAYSRVWKLMDEDHVDLDAATYRTLAQGFDVRVYNLGKAAVQLTTGVANAAVPRESAYLQLNKFKDDMAEAEYGINTARPPATVSPLAASSRIFAADLTNQALEALQTYLETGQDDSRSRGLELYRQAVDSLNSARTGQ